MTHEDVGLANAFGPTLVVLAAQERIDGCCTHTLLAFLFDGAVSQFGHTRCPAIGKPTIVLHVTQTTDKGEFLAVLLLAGIELGFGSCVGTDGA